MFHVSLRGIAETKEAELPLFTDERVIILEPQAILDNHWIKQGTWEPTSKLREIFSIMDLADKDPLDGGGIDRPRRSTRGYKPNPKYMRPWWVASFMYFSFMQLCLVLRVFAYFVYVGLCSS